MEAALERVTGLLRRPNSCKMLLRPLPPAPALPTPEVGGEEFSEPPERERTLRRLLVVATSFPFVSPLSRERLLLVTSVNAALLAASDDSTSSSFSS